MLSLPDWGLLRRRAAHSSHHAATVGHRQYVRGSAECGGALGPPLLHAHLVASVEPGRLSRIAHMGPASSAPQQYGDAAHQHDSEIGAVSPLHGGVSRASCLLRVESAMKGDMWVHCHPAAEALAAAHIRLAEHARVLEFGAKA